MLLYQVPDGGTQLDVRLVNETVWLNIDQMAKLFGVDKSGISRHLKNIFESGELVREATVTNFAMVRVEGVREVKRNIDFYNLDAIISVGYRVNSILATRFRIWATQRLWEYLMENFSINGHDQHGIGRVESMVEQPTATDSANDQRLAKECNSDATTDKNLPFESESSLPLEIFPQDAINFHNLQKQAAKDQQDVSFFLSFTGRILGYFKKKTYYTILTRNTANIYPEKTLA